MAEQAYLHQDWETAAQEYSHALEGATDQAEIQEIRERLRECSNKASAARLEKAKEYSSLGRIKDALEQARKSIEFRSTEEGISLVNELRIKVGAVILAEAKAFLEGEEWDQALLQLEQAYKLNPSAEIITLTTHAKKKSRAFHQKEFERHYSEAHLLLEKRKWHAARTEFESAHLHSSTERSRDQAEFSSIMAEAQTGFDREPSDAFTAAAIAHRYEQALKFGIDREHVQLQLAAVRMANYRVSITGALVSPLKPQSMKPWDGLPSGSTIKAAKELMGSLGSIFPEAKAAALSTEALELAAGSIEPPDCYPLVIVGNSRFGGRDFTDQDDFSPSWHLSIDFNSVNAFDSRVLHIFVKDKDLSEDDNIGSHQINLGSLVRNPGSRRIRLVDENGKLSANGLLELQVTIERVN